MPPTAARPLPTALGLPLVVAVAVVAHAVSFHRTAVPARDGVAFVRLAARLDAADGPAAVVDALREAEHPPGYPAVVWAAWRLTRTSPSPDPDELMTAALLASAAAGVGLAVAHHRLGTAIGGPVAGGTAAVLFQLLPVPARLTADALSDGLFLTAATTALWAVVTAERPVGFVAAGLAAGFAYLVRPEGLAVVGAVGLWLTARAVGRRLPARRVVAAGLGLTVGFAVLAGPYMAAIGGLTNKPTGRKLLDRTVTSNRPVAGPPLAAWSPAGHPGRVVAGMAAEAGQTFFYGPGLVCLAGAAAVLRAPGRAAVAALPVGWAGLHLLLVGGVGLTGGYTSGRHLLPVVAVGCLFATHGTTAMTGLLARAVGRRAAVVVVAVGWAGAAAGGVWHLTRPVRAERVGLAEAGRWLGEHARPGDRIVDPYEWPTFYAGRGLGPEPTAPFTGVVYAVLDDPGRRPNSPHPQLGYAEAVAKCGRRVFGWPAETESARTAVYLYDTRPGH